jgi:hypothetical protein
MHRKEEKKEKENKTATHGLSGSLNVGGGKSCRPRSVRLSHKSKVSLSQAFSTTLSEGLTDCDVRPWPDRL